MTFTNDHRRLWRAIRDRGPLTLDGLSRLVPDEPLLRDPFAQQCWLRDHLADLVEAGHLRTWHDWGAGWNVWDLTREHRARWPRRSTAA